MNLFDLIYRIALYMPVLLISLSVHEFAHAWMAWRLKDDTAALQGRLTLNPLAHIDPVGTVLMPILGIVFPGAPILGWARPVPVTPHRFTRKISMKTGMLLTSLAGPVSNLLLALLGTAVLAAVSRLWTWEQLLAPGTTAHTVGTILSAFISLNAILMVFNLLPVPPLDGGNILASILPRKHELKLLALQQHGFLILILLLMVGGRFLMYLQYFTIKALFFPFGLQPALLYYLR